MRSRVVLVLLLMSATAMADPATAKKAYDKGFVQYNLQNYQDALAMFQRAYEEMPDPAFLYNIGQCQRFLGKYTEAARSYRRYAEQSELGAHTRDQVDKLIAEVEKAAKQQVVARDASPTSATPPPPAGAAAPGHPTDAPAYRSKLGWSLIGSGLLLIGVGGGLLGHGYDLQGRPFSSLQERKDLTESASAYQGAGWAMLGIGAGSLIGGAIVFGVLHHRQHAGHLEVARE